MKYKIENPDGSGYSTDLINKEQAINYAKQYSLDNSGSYTVYKQIGKTVFDWLKIGYADRGIWYGN